MLNYTALHYTHLTACFHNGQPGCAGTRMLNCSEFSMMYWTTQEWFDILGIRWCRWRWWQPELSDV